MTPDADLEILYASVSRVLSKWERLEGTLSLLFATFVSGHNSEAARRAYVAVRTFEGRAEMLRAASEVWFDTNQHSDLLTEFKTILSAITSFSPRRNDIAHGVVYKWTARAIPESEYQVGWALWPSHASFKDRDVNNAPKYCYTSVEIKYFEQQFAALMDPILILSQQLATVGLFHMGAIGPLAFAS